MQIKIGVKGHTIREITNNEETINKTKQKSIIKILLNRF